MAPHLLVHIERRAATHSLTVYTKRHMLEEETPSNVRPSDLLPHPPGSVSPLHPGPLLLFSKTFSHPTTPRTVLFIAFSIVPVVPRAPVISQDRRANAQQQTQTPEPGVQKQRVRAHVKRRPFATGSKKSLRKLPGPLEWNSPASVYRIRKATMAAAFARRDHSAGRRDSIRTLGGIMGPRDTLDMQIADNKTRALTENRSGSSREQGNDQFRNEE